MKCFYSVAARRATAGCLLAAALIAPVVRAANTESVATYPSKPVRFIVPFVAGAGTDTTGRVIAGKLSELWGQQVVVDNRSGGTGVIGVDLTAKALPDGYTICLISGSQTVFSAVNDKLPYDLTKDLKGITQMTTLPYAVYVYSGLPVNNIKEMIAYAKANPGKITFASSGTGGLQHLAGELFAHMAGVKLLHVPFKGAGAGILAILSGEVQSGFSTLLGVKPHAANGRIRILAITAAKRSPNAPDIPTVAESVPGYVVDQWYGLVITAKASPALVNKINGAVLTALKSPDVIARLGADGSTPVGTTPEQFTEHVKSEIIKWRKLAKEANLSLSQSQ
jgi:tripartite-type tricarboxylate transporter receptor subunit TctC